FANLKTTESRAIISSDDDDDIFHAQCFEQNYQFQPAITLSSIVARKQNHLLRNPRKVTWAILYRRKHKKSQEEETTKKRTRRTHKFQRAIVGAPLNGIMAKRNQGPEVRKAQGEQAIGAVKEQKKSQKATKRAAAPPKPKAAPKQKAAKNVEKAAPRVGGKR
ncbi:60S ribosomal protein L24-like, partial [Harmonia axyridis]|uniref:60S ribosomal protein L24-like n=1 Tax=Harmonia axyridis TaxID=115357 RepID=UPI001E279491